MDPDVIKYFLDQGLDRLPDFSRGDQGLRREPGNAAARNFIPLANSTTRPNLKGPWQSEDTAGLDFAKVRLVRHSAARKFLYSVAGSDQTRSCSAGTRSRRELAKHP